MKTVCLGKTGFSAFARIDVDVGLTGNRIAQPKHRSASMALTGLICAERLREQPPAEDSGRTNGYQSDCWNKNRHDPSVGRRKSSHRGHCASCSPMSCGAGEVARDRRLLRRAGHMGVNRNRNALPAQRPVTSLKAESPLVPSWSSYASTTLAILPLATSSLLNNSPLANLST